MIGLAGLPDGAHIAALGDHALWLVIRRGAIVSAQEWDAEGNLLRQWHMRGKSRRRLAAVIATAVTEQGVMTIA